MVVVLFIIWLVVCAYYWGRTQVSWATKRYLDRVLKVPPPTKKRLTEKV